MIGYIKGTVDEIREDFIILECGGIGYRIFVSSLFINNITYGEQIKVFTHFSVREDSISLYGFLKKEELDIYRLLLTVSGVGPKGAMGIMSNMSADEFRYAVLTSDFKKFSAAPGIGRKTAQKILLELKDKFDFDTSFNESGSDVNENISLSSDSVSDTVEALIALGYTGSASLKAVKAAVAEVGAEDTGMLLKRSLMHI